MTSNVRRVRWAGVEFQPDLKKPIKPVRLGIVLYELSPRSGRSVVVIGRVPRREHRPPEFESVCEMTMDLAADWVDSMVKDIMEAKPDDPVVELASRWHWNLYVVEPVTKRLGPRVTLDSTAKGLYEAFVGEPFGGRELREPGVRSRVSMRTQSSREMRLADLPRAWLAERITRSVGFATQA